MRITAVLLIAGAATCFSLLLEVAPKSPMPVHARFQEARIDETTFRKLRVGMTRRQVEAVLGPPIDKNTRRLALIRGIYVIGCGDGSAVEMERELAMEPPLDTNISLLVGAEAQVLRWTTDQGMVLVVLKKGIAQQLNFYEVGEYERGGRRSILDPMDSPFVKKMIEDLLQPVGQQH